MNAKLKQRLVDYDKLLDAQLKHSQMISWVRDLAPWQVIAHLTFPWQASIWSAQRCFEKFMCKHLPRVSYFYALEENPGRDGYHVHALWGDARNVFRKEAWASWFEKYGRARIEPVRNEGDVSDYCAKYVTKEGSWWNVKLQWHRIQALHDRAFVLRSTSVEASSTFVSPGGARTETRTRPHITNAI